MSKNLFNSILTSRPNSNRFDLSHDLKMSFKMGTLTPTCVLDVVPGDSFRISVENMLRFTPLVAPIMHQVKVKTYFFFVANRLLWPNWEDFITGTDDTIVPPYGDMGTLYQAEVGSLADYMGLPVPMQAGVQFDLLPFAAYNLIYDEWFRDENLAAEKFIPLTDGDNTSNYFNTWIGFVHNRAWENDYFTSSLPFAQKGQAVTLPLVEDTNVLVGLSGTNQAGIVRQDDGTIDSGRTTLIADNSGFLENNTEGAFYDPNGTLSVNINESAVTINQLREAFRMQEFLELDATGGTRYTETIYAHFGVRSKDARLQRPELIGIVGGNMTISEVLASTAATDQPLATMAGHGISVSGGSGLNYYAQEHGYIIGMINVQPTTAYQQGLPRKWSRTERTDYFWPKFAHIGEQEVLNKELYVQHSEPDSTFGYVPRYSEYKYESNRVAGEMKTTLSHWHMGRIFASEPALNEAFISADPTTRIFAVETGDHIIGHIYNNIQASRLMPKYGKPML